MRKPGFILMVGVVGCIAAFAFFYQAGTASTREMLRQTHPELAWLKKEFNLGDADFTRIVALHEAYLPKCAERCRLIEEQNEKLRAMLAETNSITPAIEELIALRARMRSDCEAEMLKHFFEVSRTMPPEQGKRYLAWVEQQTFMRGGAMEQQHHQHHQHH